MVEQQPGETQLPDWLDELFKVDRLDNVTVDAELVTLGDVPVFTGRGQDHYRDHLGARVSPDLRQDLETIDLGQFQVKQDEPGLVVNVAVRVAALAEDKINCFYPVTVHLDPVR